MTNQANIVKAYSTLLNLAIDCNDDEKVEVLMQEAEAELDAEHLAILIAKF